jgi:hypothetical protein
MKQPSYPCSCYICKKQSNSLGIVTHFMRAHGDPTEKSLWNNSSNTNKYKKVINEQLYLTSPSLCKECKSIIPYNKRTNNFCSRSCSAIASNKSRSESGWTQSEESRKSIRSSLHSFNKSHVISGPYTKIHFRTCKFCNKTFATSGRTIVCKCCQHLKWSNNRDEYSFKFNIFDYPDLFDLSMIQSIGWVAFGGKRGGNKNLNGLSRDHKVSVNHAKKFNYDPYYISHPVNCELMPHSENNKKKTKSSISYEELIRLVNEYDGVKDQTCTG